MITCYSCDKKSDKLKAFGKVVSKGEILNIELEDEVLCSSVGINVNKEEIIEKIGADYTEDLENGIGLEYCCPYCNSMEIEPQ